MKSSDDDEWLKNAAPVPEMPKEYWDAFPRRVVTLLGSTAQHRPPARKRWWRLVAIQGAFALSVLAIGFFVGRSHDSASEAGAILRSERMLREVLTFFPNRVRAIVEDERGVHLVLSERPDVPDSQPIWIEIQGDGFRHTAVTFSGQALQIAGDRIRVLADSGGGVTLAGDRVSWSSAAPDRVTAGLRIRAQVLPFAL